MADQMYTESGTHGSSRSTTKPGRSHTLIHNGMSLDWQRQHQEQYQLQQQYPSQQQCPSQQQHSPQQQYQMQVPSFPRQEYPQTSLAQTQMQSLQYGTTGSVHAPLDASVYDMPVSEPQSGTLWDQAVAVYDIDRYNGGAVYDTLCTGPFSGEERGSTSLPDLSLPTPSALHSTPGTQSDFGVVNRTTSTLERGSGACHGQRQNGTSEHGTMRSSPRLRRRQGETHHRVARHTKKKLWEKQYYEALLRMDELTKYHRVAQAMRMCGHPLRDPEEYKFMS